MTRIPTSADNASVDTAQSPDPQSPASFPLCLIDVGRIRPYEHNPRHGDHPEYDRIKDSIRQAGLDQPLVITQRPGAGDYIVHSGGNTRLSILKALWHETGERRFADIPCRVIPWNGETDVLLAHLRENDLRGHLTFIDKARAVCAVKRLLAAQRDEDLSQRQLEAALRQAGYGMTQARISQMIYAVNRLLPLIPFALEQGLGRPQVERIRALERAAKAVWQQGAVGSNEEFTEVFEALCRRYDAPDWETDLLHGALASEIAVTLEVGIQTARTMLDVQLAGREWIPLPLEPTPPEEGPSPGDATLATTEGPESQIPSTSPPAIPPAPTPGSKPRAVDPPRDDASGPRIPPHHGSPERSGREGSAPTGSAGSGPPGVCRDLPSLRRQAAALALGLAQRHAMGELVIRVPEAGLGFLLRDVPESVPSSDPRPNPDPRRPLLWSQLAACCDLTQAPAAFLKARIPETSRLRRALAADPSTPTPDCFPHPDCHQMGFLLWRHLEEQDWQDLRGLMDTYRLIHQVAKRTEADGVSLWTEPSSIS